MHVEKIALTPTSKFPLICDIAKVQHFLPDYKLFRLLELAKMSHLAQDALTSRSVRRLVTPDGHLVTKCQAPCGMTAPG